jgi:hypothetical protein
VAQGPSRRRGSGSGRRRRPAHRRVHAHLDRVRERLRGRRRGEPLLLRVPLRRAVDRSGGNRRRCSAATACEITRCGVSASAGAAAKASRTIIRRLFESRESLRPVSMPVGSPSDITLSVWRVAPATCQPPTWPLLGKPRSPCQALLALLTPSALPPNQALRRRHGGMTRYKALTGLSSASGPLRECELRPIENGVCVRVPERRGDSCRSRPMEDH